MHTSAVCPHSHSLPLIPAHDICHPCHFSVFLVRFLGDSSSLSPPVQVSGTAESRVGVYLAMVHHSRQTPPHLSLPPPPVNTSRHEHPHLNQRHFAGPEKRWQWNLATTSPWSLATASTMRRSCAKGCPWQHLTGPTTMRAAWRKSSRSVGSMCPLT